ncbi:ABC transporter ATP-binding protein [Ethanoligenens harbinense]|nr:ABC transporter ATP-binding protein [Ethanoligenens harbinense]AVQ97321.1 ABC transporter ATP-binding protein [Ethanoligenens harbinense YUAN-3]AYF39985.1 ABC transporter ATP-binding protein [Ethanoligenens harbinense]AYF42813.1 ABC transporter ATP-binding protein [Ethanoligenens harbinense]QCN93566.1 ABC transporter ATP-binding protein [Ethanoligenens harbinense]
METILTVKNLSKRFKEKEVLKGLDFTVDAGEILCLLGPNGAGKSTTINILTGVLGHDGGEVLYHGQSIRGRLRAYRQRLGVVPQDIALYEELTAERNLRFFAGLYGLRGRELDRATDEALALAGLEDRRRDVIKTFSGGMKRRLNIACAIAHRPELVIMDEPTVGIDPQSRNHILESIRTLRGQGMTVLYTTHYMEEVEAISSRIIIMDHGQIIAEGTKESLKQAYEDQRRYTLTVEGAEGLQASDLYRVEGIVSAQIGEHAVEITSLRGVANLDRIIALLYEKGVEIQNITSEEASLETVFLKLTGRTLRD